MRSKVCLLFTNFCSNEYFSSYISSGISAIKTELYNENRKSFQLRVLVDFGQTKNVCLTAEIIDFYTCLIRICSLSKSEKEFNKFPSYKEWKSQVHQSKKYYEIISVQINCRNFKSKVWYGQKIKYLLKFHGKNLAIWETLRLKKTTIALF